MNHLTALQGLLAPLGVYQWEGSFQQAELSAMGAALDNCCGQLEEIQQEMNLLTAQGEGLDRISRLLAREPLAQEVEARRKALEALLRIGDRSFTLQALRDNLRGCGLRVELMETDVPQQVQVSFPYVGGVPAEFAGIRGIVEEILPCHLEILYHFYYLLWSQLEELGWTWADVEAQELSWAEFEGMGALPL